MGEDKRELFPFDKQAPRSDDRDAIFSRAADNKDHDFFRLCFGEGGLYLRRKKLPDVRGKDRLGESVLSEDIVIKKTHLPLDVQGLQDRLKIFHREGNGMAVSRNVFPGLIQGAMEPHN